MAAQEVAQSVHGTFHRDELPRYVCTFLDRHGKQRWRYRRDGISGYFTDRPGTKIFDREYDDFTQGIIPERRPRRATSRFSVYFMSCRNAIKIGYAKDPHKRVKAHQISQPVKVGLMVTVPGGRELEREYHRLFAAHRLRGEWFSDAPEILNEVRRLRRGETPLPVSQQAIERD